MPVLVILIGVIMSINPQVAGGFVIGVGLFMLMMR
jgi:hypothetical protein